MSNAFKSLAAAAAILMSGAAAFAQGAGGAERLQVAANTSGQEAARVARQLADAANGLSENELRRECRQIYQIVQNADPAIADAINQAILESENRRLAICLEEFAQIAPAAIDDLPNQDDEGRFNDTGSSG
ncbi:hypothetical protein H2509_08375 [Stappia sp. F7233]|uniref:Uncharacterized protein n=1 Tax=Stappia albiluteola TaxID=2758565 RepID=A0A839AEZ5_9HYPH|nr:hypothetical protein [Stappia albiluteola]MBA5777139.1 hypothetical protein [Stappia albiluteola]